MFWRKRPALKVCHSDAGLSFRMARRRTLVAAAVMNDAKPARKRVRVHLSPAVLRNGR
jgi:hypothetical protein